VAGQHTPAPALPRRCTRCWGCRAGRDARTRSCTSANTSPGQPRCGGGGGGGEGGHDGAAGGGPGAHWRPRPRLQASHGGQGDTRGHGADHGGHGGADLTMWGGCGRRSELGLGQWTGDWVPVGVEGGQELAGILGTNSVAWAGPRGRSRGANVPPCLTSRCAQREPHLVIHGVDKVRHGFGREGGHAQGPPTIGPDHPHLGSVAGVMKNVGKLDEPMPWVQAAKRSQM
jgi:hypothetical protein